jgi:hypothetical protein
MNAPDPQPAVYLDATDLADILGLSLRTIILRARHRPWLLPPRAELLDRELLRWRQDVVESWLAENSSKPLKF